MAPFQATYRITGMGLTIGEGHVRLRHVGGGYVYERHTTARGIAALFRNDRVRERSEGVFDGAHPVPRLYEYHLRRGDTERHERIDFAPDTGTATDRYKGRSLTLELPAGYQDRASHELALFADLGAGRSALRYPVVTRHKLKDYAFEVLGEEEIEVPYGRFRTLKLRVLHDGDKRSTELWVAPELDYLAVRTDHIEKGYRASMVLVDLERGR